MLKINDKLFGELEYDDSWVGKIYIPFFSEKLSADLVIECYDDEDITEKQRNAYRLFFSKLSENMIVVEQAIYDYYQNVYQGYRDKFGVDKQNDWAPIVNAPSELKSNIEVRSIFIPQASSDSNDSTLGVLLSCTWEPELGVAVKFVNGSVVNVGCQDIIL